MTAAPTRQAHPMARRPDEDERSHRALLVWAMLHPRRSVRRACKAFGMAEGSLRRWRKFYDWDARLVGDKPHHTAWIIYRKVYLPVYLMTELDLVREWISNESIPPEPWEEPDMTDYQLAAVADTLSAATKEEGKSAREIIVAEHLRVLDKLIAYVSSEIAKGKVRVTVTDMLRLMKHKDGLLGHDTLGKKGGAAPLEESVRVRQARAAGGNLLDALVADNEEISAVLQALDSRRVKPDSFEEDQPMRKTVVLTEEEIAALGDREAEVPEVIRRPHDQGGDDSDETRDDGDDYTLMFGDELAEDEADQ